MYLRSVFLFFTLVSLMPMPCQGSVDTSVLYHTNGKLCWKDPKVYNTSYSYNDSGIVYYASGKLCWKDPEIYNNSYSYNNSGIVYHSNEKLCWKNPKVYNTSYSYNNSGIVYHANDKVCWKDPRVYNTSYSYNESGIVHHSNGKVCWKDPKVYNTSYSYNDSGKIYHSNGQLCWKDPAVYSDGGKCYNSAGELVAFQGNSIFLELGNGSSVHIGKDGTFELTIDIGGQSFFKRFFNAEFALLQNLGSTLYLYMPCLESSKESVWIFDNMNNWMIISEKS